MRNDPNDSITRRKDRGENSGPYSGLYAHLDGMSSQGLVVSGQM